MTYTVRLLKVGSVAEGDDEDDFGSGKINPFTEFPVIPGIFLQDPQASALDRLVGLRRVPGTQTIEFVDASGTATLADLLASSGLSQLTDDVTTPTGGGSQPATVVKVGGVAAADLAHAYNVVTGDQAAGKVFASPVSGTGPGLFRFLGVDDLPTIPGTKLTGLAASAYTNALNASNISSGYLAINRLDTSGAQAGYILVYDGTGLTYAPNTAGLTALTGDVTASGSGSQTATVQSVGGTAASAVASAVALVTGSVAQGRVFASPLGSAGAPAFLQLSAGYISGLAPSATTNALNASNINTGALDLAYLSTAGASSGYVLTYNGTSLAYAAIPVSGITKLNGDVTTASGTGPQNATVALVGGQSAASVATATTLVNTSRAQALVLATPLGSAGAPSFVGLSAGYISGLAPSATTNALNASNINDGALALAYLSVTGADPNEVLLYNGTQLTYQLLAGSAYSDTTNAANITGGILPSQRLQGSYSQITGLGTLSSLAVTGNLTSASAGSNASVNFGFAGANTGLYLTSTVAGISVGGQTVLSSTNALATVALPMAFNAGIQLKGSTSGALSIAVPATVTSYTLTLPDAQGAAGTVPVNDGNGNLSWSAPGGSVTYPLTAPNGTVSSPSFSFTSASSSGMYLNGSNQLALASAGTEVLRFAGSVGIFANGQVAFSQGSASVPGIGFVNNGNSGVYSTGTGNLSLTAGATQVFSATSTGVGLPKGISGGLILNGATSGAITHNAAATTTSYAVTWPAAQGAAGTVPTNDGNGALTWTTPSGGATGTVANTAGTVVQRDATTSGIFVGKAGTQFTGSGQTVSLVAANSRGLYQVTGANTSVLTATTSAVAAGQYPEYHLQHAATSGAQLLAAAVSGGNIGFHNLTTTGNLKSTQSSATISLIGLPGTSNYLVSNVTGVWIDSVGGKVLCGTILGDSNFTGTMQTSAIANSGVMRDGSNVILAGSLSTASSGTVASCAVRVGAASTGLYSSAAQNLDFSAGGTQVLNLTSSLVYAIVATQVPALTVTGGIQATSTTVTSNFSAPIQVGGTLSYGFTADPGGAGLQLTASSYLQIRGPGNGQNMYVGNGSLYYGAGIGIVPQTTANNALALSASLSIKESAAPATVSTFTHLYNDSTDKHLYAQSPTWGKICLTTADRQSTIMASSQSMTLLQNNSVYVNDGSQAATATVTLPAQSTVTDQRVRVMQSTSSFGTVISVPAGSTIQFDNQTSTSGGNISVPAAANGFSCELFLPKGKGVWMLLGAPCYGGTDTQPASVTVN